MHDETMMPFNYLMCNLDQEINEQDVFSCSRLSVNYVTLAIGEVLLLILAVCSLAAIFPRVRKQN